MSSKQLTKEIMEAIATILKDLIFHLSKSEKKVQDQIENLANTFKEMQPKASPSGTLCIDSLEIRNAEKNDQLAIKLHVSIFFPS